MTAPFFKYGLFGDDVALVVAFVIGIAFGFFLERGGFGSGRKLAAQFYFTDMAVLKVMFTAIVTAMVGVYWLSRIGVLDLSLVYLVPTHVAADALGGLILGFGFVVGGYCPGTSVVAMSTGRIDAMVYLGGIVTGTTAVGFAWPALQGWATRDQRPITLPALTNIPYGVLVLAVVLVAVAAFVAAEWAEVKSGGRALAEQSLYGVRKLTAPWVLFLAVAALGLGAAVAGSPYRGPRATVDAAQLARATAAGADHLSPASLADRLIAGTADLRIVDLRPADAYARERIPGAENVPLASLAGATFAPTDPLLLYSEDGERAAQVWMYLKARGVLHVYTLEGGYAAWRDAVLFPVLPEPKDEAARREADRRRALAAHFGGAARTAGPAATEAAPAPQLQVPAAPPPPMAPAPGAPAPKKKKEGC